MRIVAAFAPFVVLLVWASLAAASVPGPTTCQNWLRGWDPYNATDNDIRAEITHMESNGYVIVNHYFFTDYSDGINRWQTVVFVRRSGWRRQTSFACWYSYIAPFGYEGPGRDALGSRGSWYL